MLNLVEKDTIKDTIEDKPLKIGTLLVDEGFIRKADLDQAIEIQRNEAKMANLPLGKLMLKKCLIDRDQLQELLQHREIERELETFAIEKGGIAPRELARCIETKPPGMPLAEHLLTTGHLADDDIKVFLRQQLDSLKIYELALETGMVSENDLHDAIKAERPPRTIGEILCDLNLIMPLDLNSVLAKYRKHLQLGKILERRGLIDEPTLDWALKVHGLTGEPLGGILCRKGVLTEEQLYSAFSRQYNLPFEKLDGFEYSAEQRKALSEYMGKTFTDQFHIIPLRLEDSTLTVALCDPTKLMAVNSLRSKRVSLRIQCVLVAKSTMERLYTDLYGVMPPSSTPEPVQPPSPTDTSPPLPLRSEPPPPAPPDAPDSFQETVDRVTEEAEMSPKQWVHWILNRSLLNGSQEIHVDQADGARAIHIDQGLRRTNLTFRIGDALCEPSESWPEEGFQDMARQVMDAFKEIAGMDPGDRRRPQEGMFRAGIVDGAANVGDLDFSVTSCPTLAGENMTIRRILPGSPAPDLNKNELSHSLHVVVSLKQALKHADGMLLVAAPPGNGRAATLYAMLRYVHEPELKAMTVEETISFSMPEAVQTQANPSMGLSYGDMLRAALRLDPDVMLAEDLGNPESAALGINAVRRGILLLGGINAADAAAAVSQMEALCATPQTADFLKAVLAQRYVRKICPACKQTYTPSPEEWQPLFEQPPKGFTFYRGAGCPDCNFTGYRGRILLSELLVINDTVARAMKQQLSENDIRHLVIRSGAKTLIDDGLSKLNETTLSEIIDAVPREAADVFKCIQADARPAAPQVQDDMPAPRKEETAFGITLSSEDIPGAELRQLHHAYKVLVEETGRRPRTSSLGDFETFIKAHHNAICRRYGCSRVSFSVERQDKTVLLTARPVFR